MQRHVITLRDGHCDALTKQSSTLCVKMLNPLHETSDCIP